LDDLFTALALVCVLEGAAYALFPEVMKRTMLQVLAQPAANLRLAGVALTAVGVFAVWLLRS
jgi:uncharacterized protein YjeT (DUF2065 family)